MASGRDLEQVIDARARDLGDVVVGRVLPAAARRMVGPFLFLDHIGPAELPADRPLAVRPHPHIHLATVTYLFEGEIVHRDSLGSRQAIHPGAINWMTAGRGIVHSERGEPGGPRRVHGLQLWCALPDGQEDVEPSFVHHPADTLPELARGGAIVRVLAGEAYGARSPVTTLSRLFYVDVAAPAGATIDAPAGYPERAAYVVEGAVELGGERFERGRMLVLAADREIRLAAAAGTRLVFLGGDPVGPRHIYWNFVSSSRDRIEEAKRAWREGRFPKVPGDEVESIPLPEDT